MHGTTPYTYIERLHQELLHRKFVAFSRVLLAGEVVAGCLLKRPPIQRQLEYKDFLGDSTGEEDEGVLNLDLLCSDGRLGDAGLEQLVIAHAAEWAREAGYSLLAAGPASALTILTDKVDLNWTLASKAVPILHNRISSILYCDLARCSYLPYDFYYYCYEGDRACLHYIVNVMPDSSPVVRFLNSTTGIDKRVYTRHGLVQDMVSESGIDCALICR